MAKTERKDTIEYSVEIETKISKNLDIKLKKECL